MINTSANESKTLQIGIEDYKDKKENKARQAFILQKSGGY
jgi:hypothetical protein